MKPARPEPVLVTVYITKYWLSRGILEAQGEPVEEGALSGMFSVFVGGFRHHYYSRQEWHPTFGAAQERVLELSAAKKKSHQKALDELQKKTDRALKAPIPYPVSE